MSATVRRRFMLASSRVPLVLAALCATFSPSAHAQSEPAPADSGGASPVAALVAPLGGLSAKELAAVERGDAVVKVLRSSDRDEVPLLGVVALREPRRAYLERVWGEHAMLASSARRAFGVLGDPATPTDVQSLTLDQSDARALAKCRPLKCPVKLPAAVMERFRTVIAGAGHADSAADSLMRDWVLELANAYRARGDAALPEYDDTRAGERPSDGFRELVAADSSLLDTMPALARWLAGSPSAELAGGRTELHWSIEQRSGLKPLLEITQLTTYEPPGASDRAAVVTKRVYADHYFDAFLDVALVVDGVGAGRAASVDAAAGARDASEATPGAAGRARGATAAAGAYLVVLRRVKFDALPSGGLFDIRGRVIGKLRDSLRDDLARTRDSG